MAALQSDHIRVPSQRRVHDAVFETTDHTLELWERDQDRVLYIPFNGATHSPNSNRMMIGRGFLGENGYHGVVC